MEMICINCPMGCIMDVQVKESQIEVKGNSCPKGKKYAEKECTNPTRIVTSSVYVSGGNFAVVPIKTATDIPKGKIFEVLEELKHIHIQAPVHIGDMIIQDAAGTGVSVVATKEIESVNK